MWWKVASIILILYTLTVGLIVPLKTGIIDVTPNVVQAGDTVTLSAVGYNSFYTQAQIPLRAWLKIDSVHALTATTVRAIDDTHLSATFAIPTTLPRQKITDATFVIDHPTDGTSLKPSALVIKPLADSLARRDDMAAWTATPIKNLHTHQGITFPYRNILSETIRNTYYHIPLWFAMIILFTIALVNAWKYLRTNNLQYDYKSAAYIQVGMLYGILGLVTGAIWAKHTWGAYWSWDIKQNVSAIALLIYAAYFVLRRSFEDPEKQARLSSVYGIFAYFAMIPLLFVIPRLADSLHPGNGGNPGFGGQDLDHTMRMFFYPANIGWILLGIWLATLTYRLLRLRERNALQLNS